MNFEQLKKNINSLFTSSKIIENFPDMILYIDFDGFVKAVNKKAADYFGISENITINEFINNGLKFVTDAAKSKKAVLITKTGVNNKKEYLELSASKLENGYCVSIRDNTKTINDTTEKDGIERFNNDKNAMLVNLENDIKSPINSIIGFSQGLVDGIGGKITPKQDKYLNIIMNNANELKEFSDKFLDFSYAESLLYEPDMKKFDSVSEIKNILKTYEQTLDFQKVEFEFDYSSVDSRGIINDIKAFRKIIENVLEVSLSLTKNGKIYLRLAPPNNESFITYGLEENNRYLQLIIKDTGTNLSKDEMEHICNPYAKVDKGRKIFVRSLRLGIASILAKRSDGVFTINSDSGQGNLYNIIIPDRRTSNE